MPISVSDIEKLVQPLLEEQGVLLCYAEIKGSIRNPLFQLFIDREDGFVTVKDCVAVNRSTQDLLGLQDSVPEDYRLEVSSPGIDYPLSEIWQFRKNIGRLIQKKESDIQVTENDVSISGRIKDVGVDGNISICTESGNREYSISELAGSCIVLETPKKKKMKRKRHETRSR
ncbi:MAG: hypothetical protein HN590_07150 [Calditrichaeota bacterium]|nr:hypothetical protein [Calditrichota bacterium]